MHKKSLVIVCAFALATLTHVTTAGAQAAPDPNKIVTLADVHAVLGGKFASRTVEPGIIKYEEVGGPRVVEVSVSIVEPGKLESIKIARVQEGQTVDDIPGLGDFAIYRPQDNFSTVEKTKKTGAVWLEVRVHNVEGAAAKADTKRFSIELLKRGTPRL